MITMQTTVVILICTLSLALLARQGYRTFFPAKGKACGGDCCSGGVKDPAPKTAPIQMVRSSDLARRAAEIKRG